MASYQFEIVNMQHSQKQTYPRRPTGAMTTTMPFTTQYSFPSALEPVQVPTGYFPIEVVQFWRGECEPYRPYPLHWAIIVRTSERRGNRHEIVGDTYTYTTRHRFDIPLDMCDDWRGGHVVGFVRPDKMDQLFERIASVPVRHQQRSWTDQNWVWEALFGLHYHYLYTDAEMFFPALQTQMCRLLEAWEFGEI